MEQVSDDGIELSWIEVDLQGDRCFTIIQGFRDRLSDDGEGGAVLVVNLLKRFVDVKRSGRSGKEI